MIYSTKQDDHITCTFHNLPVYPMISKSGFEYYLCRAETQNRHNGQIGNGHFLQNPQDDRNLSDYFDYYQGKQ